jgi:hypothetical protein
MPIGMFWALNIAFAGTCVVLLVVLLYIYGKNASQIHSKFTIGLVVFAILFLVENLAGIWAYATMSTSAGSEIAIPMLVLNVTEMGALATLVAITWD